MDKMNKVAVLTFMYDEGYDGIRYISETQCFSVDENLYLKVFNYIKKWADDKNIDIPIDNEYYTKGLRKEVFELIYNEDGRCIFIDDYEVNFSINHIN